MNSFFNKIYFLFFSLCFFIFSTAYVFAVDEHISSFQVEITASKDGLMEVRERITYNFEETLRHGIYREIPLIAKVGDLYRMIGITVEDVSRDNKSEPYTVENSADQIRIKIGAKNRTLTGEHIYEILYRVENGIGSNYEDHDEIYWNVTGNNWNVPISTVSALLKTDFIVVMGKTICFTGLSGSTESDCRIEKTKDGVLITTNKALLVNEGLTFVSSFPVNTFPQSILQKNKPMATDLRNFLLVFIPILVVLNFILAPYLIYWYFKNRNKKRFGKPVVNFDLPKDGKGGRIPPAEAGTIDIAKLDINDITATIFDLAIRKYIIIEKNKLKKKILNWGEKESFTLKKVKEWKGLSEFETLLLEAVFQGQKEAELSEFSISYTKFKELEEINFKSLIKRGFYTKNPGMQRSVLFVLGIVSFFTFNFVLGPVLFFLSKMLNGRTEEGDEIDWRIDGLKIFLKATNRYNEWQVKNILTIEKMIPYAISLGYIDEFMKQLKILKPDFEPSWYRGSGSFYTSYALFASSVNTNTTTSASSSSSGFSGGFSGGGGGGGGGGSW